MNKPLQLPLFEPASSWTPPSEFPSLVGVRRISLDVETRDPNLNELGPGTHRGDAYICGVALGIEGGGRWYFPVRHREGGNLDPRLVFSWLRDELRSYRGEVVGARLIYDLEHLHFEGVDVNEACGLIDVQLAEPLLDEHRLEYNLDALAEHHLGEHKREELLREAAIAYGFGRTAQTIKQNLWQLPARYAGPYGEGDADLPLRIYARQAPLLEAQGLTPLFRDLECALIRPLLAMRLRGVRVDLDAADRARRALVAKRDACLTEVRRWAGPKAELMKADVLGRALAARNLPVPTTPKSHQYSITKPFLERHQADPLARAIMEGRKYEVVINTFIDGIRQHSVKGRIYTQFNQLKTDDGGTIARFSSSTPNLQNQPARDEELGPLIRSIFVPEAGEVWHRLDYSQIEYRFLAHFASGPGSEEAREAYRTNPKTDYHKFVAEMLGVDPEDKIKRKRVKNTNFAKGYGAMAPRLAETFGCSLEEAIEFIDEYDRKLPFAKHTFERAERVAKQRGYVKTIMGRYGRFDRWVPSGKGGRHKPPLPLDRARVEYGTDLVRAGTYMALNRALQGSAADLMKKAMVEVHRAGISAVLGAPLLTVHDELDFSAPDSPAGLEAIAEVKRIMETCMTLRVPIVAEAESGPNWGNCE